APRRRAPLPPLGRASVVSRPAVEDALSPLEALRQRHPHRHPRHAHRLRRRGARHRRRLHPRPGAHLSLPHPGRRRRRHVPLPDPLHHDGGDAAACRHQPVGRRRARDAAHHRRRHGGTVRRPRGAEPQGRVLPPASRHPRPRRRHPLRHRSRGDAAGALLARHCGGTAMTATGRARTVMSRLPLAAAALAGLLVSLAPAAAETLILSLSTHRVAITSTYTGSSIVVFGAIARDERTAARAAPYDIVVTVRGPRRTTIVREKERVGPLWLNTSQRRF